MKRPIAPQEIARYFAKQQAKERGPIQGAQKRAISGPNRQGPPRQQNRNGLMRLGTAFGRK